jgi:hypothetical protein
MGPLLTTNSLGNWENGRAGGRESEMPQRECSENPDSCLCYVIRHGWFLGFEFSAISAPSGSSQRDFLCHLQSGPCLEVTQRGLTPGHCGGSVHKEMEAGYSTCQPSLRPLELQILNKSHPRAHHGNNTWTAASLSASVVWVYLFHLPCSEQISGWVWGQQPVRRRQPK